MTGSQHTLWVRERNFLDVCCKRSNVPRRIGSSLVLGAPRTKCSAGNCVAWPRTISSHPGCIHSSHRYHAHSWLTQILLQPHKARSVAKGLFLWRPCSLPDSAERCQLPSDSSASRYRTQPTANDLDGNTQPICSFSGKEYPGMVLNLRGVCVELICGRLIKHPIGLRI